MTDIYTQWIDAFPIVSIEDPLAEDDWAGWSSLVAKIGDKIQVVGDDLFVTNVTRLQRGIDEAAASALLVKVNQIGSLTETLDAVEHGSARRLRLHDEPPLRGDRGHHDRRPGRGHELRSDQVRRSGPDRPGGQVQPAAADRGRPRRCGPLRRCRRRSRGSRPDADGPTADRASGSRSRARSAARPYGQPIGQGRRLRDGQGAPRRRRGRGVLPRCRDADQLGRHAVEPVSQAEQDAEAGRRQAEAAPSLQPDRPGPSLSRS